MKILITISFLLLSFASCTVMNNMYVNDPWPMGKGNAEFILGGGTGLKPKVEDISNEGEITFSGDLEMAPILFLGARFGLGHMINIRTDLHLPFAVAGVGVRGGIQFSALSKESKLNFAFGADGRLNFAKDSIRFLWTDWPMDLESEGSSGVDLYLPISYKINDDTKIILTPRYSLTWISIRHNQGEPGTWKYKPRYPSLSLGARIRRMYIESTLIAHDKKFYPSFGLAYFFTE